MSGTKVKGLLKGLRYISQQIFDEKEDEIEIGFPTDVKHVAHIGSDDPSANAPSWMNEYKSANPSGGAVEDTETTEGKSKSSNPKEKPTKHRHLIPKSRHQSIDQESNPPTTKKTTRRHNRSSDPSADSSTQDASSGGSRHRRHRRGSTNNDSDSVPADIPTDTKAHRRRSKNSEDGSVKERSSRRSSKGDSLTDISVTDFGSDSVADTGNEPKYT